MELKKLRTARKGVYTTYVFLSILLATILAIILTWNSLSTLDFLELLGLSRRLASVQCGDRTVSAYYVYVHATTNPDVQVRVKTEGLFSDHENTIFIIDADSDSATIRCVGSDSVTLFLFRESNLIAERNLSILDTVLRIERDP